MTTTQAAANPFVLLLNPQAVFAAIENSDRLARLASRICRPLDKLPPRPADGEVSADDASVIDAEVDVHQAE